MDYNSNYEGVDVERLLKKIDEEVYTKAEVNNAITSAITETLNTPV